MDNLEKEILDIINSIKSFIELEKGFGVDMYYKKLPRIESKDYELEKLELEVVLCRMCSLCSNRNNVVFGVGNPYAKLMFIGEAPGYEEDMQGLPFVGKAGQLLTKIIEAMGLKRKDVYITNVVKCRPPKNRDPFPTEVLSCEGYLSRQIDIIKPKVICALGKVSSQSLLKSQSPISNLRGRFHLYRGIKLMPTFHPAYLLRNPQDKKLVWHDMKMVMKELNKVES